MLTWLGKLFKPRYRVVLEHEGFWSAERWTFPFGWMYIPQILGATRAQSEEKLSLVRIGKYKEIHGVE